MQKINWINANKAEAVTISNKFWEDISEKAYPLSKGAMRIPISLEPYFISRSKNIDLQNKICLVLSALKK